MGISRSYSSKAANTKSLDIETIYQKELNKKRITIERTMELQELMNTCDWWTKEVMIHIDIEKEKTKKHDRECRKEKQLLDYFVKQVQFLKFYMVFNC